MFRHEVRKTDPKMTRPAPLPCRKLLQCFPDRAVQGSVSQTAGGALREAGGDTQTKHKAGTVCTKCDYNVIQYRAKTAISYLIIVVVVVVGIIIIVVVIASTTTATITTTTTITIIITIVIIIIVVVDNVDDDNGSDDIVDLIVFVTIIIIVAFFRYRSFSQGLPGQRSL